MKSLKGNIKPTPLMSLIQSIGKPENETFFRQDALLAVVSLSKGQDEKETTPPLGVTESIQHHLGESKKFTAYGIITQVGDTECAKAQTNNPANFSYVVSEFIKQAGGITHSICEEDYNPLMTEIGSHIENQLGLKLNEIELRHTNVIENTIGLKCTQTQNQTQSQGTCPAWHFDSQENKIIFQTPLTGHVTVNVSYDYQL